MDGSGSGRAYTNEEYVGFFFQAEDGIRDYKVTGVQTCALPICELRLTWTYSTQRHNHTTIEQLATQTMGALRQIIEHCAQPGAGGRTPSDFPLTDRKSVVWGKSVDLGGRRIIKKKK